MNEPLLTQSAVTDKIKSTLGNGRGTLALAIIGVALSTASAFMFCLASMGFDFSQLANSTFWSRWASMFISMLSAYVFVIIHKDESNRLSDWYLEKTSLLLELSISAGINFDEYIEDFNLQRRIAWFKNDINAKITKLGLKIMARRLAGKPIEKLENKVAIYRSYLTDDYIEKNKYALKTKSRPIYAAQVLTESQKGQGSEENFRSAGAYYGGKIIIKVVFSMLMTAGFASVVVQNFMAGVDVASITMTIFTLLSLVISIVSAIFAANGCYKTVYVPNLLFKIKILSGYEGWRNKNKEKNRRGAVAVEAE